MNCLHRFLLLGLCSAALAAEEVLPSPAPEVGAPPLAQPVVLTQGDDGSVCLHARDGVVHGATLRYEAQKHKNAMGHWTSQDDWAGWTFTLSQPGTFAVEILQGCGKGSGGSAVVVAIDGQPLTFTVEDTGHFQNFVKRGIGEVTLAHPGTITVSVKALSKPGVAVMDLRQVILTPVKK